MAAETSDQYETLHVQYPPGYGRGPLPSPPVSRWALGSVLAVGTGGLLVLGAALAALVTLYVQGQAELREARAELAAAGVLLNPDSPHSPGESSAVAQRRKDQLGRWLQGLALGWRYHQGNIYFFSAERKRWDEAQVACRATHAHLTSITSSEEQDYLARESRGGTYWIGLVATGPGGSWHWVDGSPYSSAQSFWAAGQPDNVDHGEWGRESCAQIHPVGNSLWNDHNCNFTFFWICKRDLSGP
ncbi:C-type lectin domain family 4 member F-like [Cuculus canorus]|uniref:C-type lectin domain family 4 member F-like n=1 Tax=Cuculus canorus TaxID=55661 RepID=UPI0023AABA9D|nr:C-type lectin domain family 4 member F-like [Cuculus canorus]